MSSNIYILALNVAPKVNTGVLTKLIKDVNIMDSKSQYYHIVSLHSLTLHNHLSSHLDGFPPFTQLGLLDGSMGCLPICI